MVFVFTAILVLWITMIFIEICNIFVIIKNKFFNNNLLFYILLIPIFIVSSENILYFILIRIFDKIFEQDNNYIIVLTLKLLLLIDLILIL